MKQNELMKLAADADDALKNNLLDKALEISEVISHYNRAAGLAYKGVVALRKEDFDLAEELLLKAFSSMQSNTWLWPTSYPPTLKSGTLKRPWLLASKPRWQ